MSVELVWPLDCNLDIVVGSIWRLTGQRETQMTEAVYMSDKVKGVSRGTQRGIAQPKSGFKHCFYGETNLNGEWNVRWIRDASEYERVVRTTQRCKKCDVIIVPLNHRHPTGFCPHFPKYREERHEIQKLEKIGTSKQPSSLRADRKSQPGDGSCFFHSVGYQLGKSAADVRREVVEWMTRNQNTQINGRTLSKWTEWEGGNYLDRMRNGAWGGATEMAILTHMYPSFSFHVYRHRSGDLYDLITQVGDGPKRILLVWSGSHYDALQSK